MKRTLLILVSIFAVISAYAEITVKASAPSAVAVGQQFRVEYSANIKTNINSVLFIYYPTIVDCSIKYQ